jgi:hypothetical protein
MEFNSLYPEFLVRNLELSLRFYCDTLGFVVEYDRPCVLFNTLVLKKTKKYRYTFEFYGFSCNHYVSSWFPTSSQLLYVFQYAKQNLIDKYPLDYATADNFINISKWLETLKWRDRRGSNPRPPA